MAYQVFLLEELDVDNWTELDVEAVDFSTIYSIADITDISARKDNITKQIAFKGSKVNNQAFGNLFHQNMISDFDFDNRLFFNYNPLRTVECLIYEDSVLLLRGSLRVLEIDVDKNNNIVYQTVVTGSLITLKEVLTEKKLIDLSFEDLRHHYNWDNISDTWDVRTERYDTSTSGFTYSPFSKGDGYVYPYMDYGYIFKKLEANGDLNFIHGLNFRPAVYVREYLNRIFNQPELSGFTYEIKADTSFTDKFNSLIIPNSDEKLRYKYFGFNVTASKPFVLIETQEGGTYNAITGRKLLHLNNISALPSNTIDSLISHQYNTVLNIDRTFTADCRAGVNVSSVTNPHGYPLTFTISVMERDFSDNESPDDWNVLGQKSFTVAANSAVINRVLTIDIGERDWLDSKQVGLQAKIQYPFAFPHAISDVTWQISAAAISFPKDETTPFQTEVQLASGLDTIVPTAPDKISQMDFIKSVISQFNLYVYSEKARPKHLIFQNYDDYYALTQVNLLATTGLDWTKKIDYVSGLKIKSNVKIPKQYLFTYKDDGDFINADYKKSFNEIYGSFTFDDSLGLSDEKKIELVFSPSPLVQYAGTGKIHPAIYTIDSNNKKPIKSNIRILYYNGLKAGNEYAIGLDVRSTAGVYDSTLIASGITSYPQVGNYYLDAGLTNTTPIQDLYFGLGKRVYFDFNPAIDTCPTAYTTYYIGQITDLTNPNVTYIEADVYLNELDITNLDLRTPVFIDLGELGHSYFKVLNVEYENNKTTSKVSMQKIVI